MDKELSENSRVFEIVREYAPGDYCQLSLDTGEMIAREILEGLLDWAIQARQNLQNKKTGQGYSKPADTQAQQVIGGKIKAFQEMIDKLQYLKDKFLKEV